MKTTRQQETEQILLDHYQQLYRLALSYVKTEADALDVVQESAYKAYRDCRKVNESLHLKTWIYRIVINTSLDFLRKKGREVPLEEWGPEPGNSSAYENLEVMELINHLSDKEKALIILRYFQDLKLEEIAEVLNENVNTVKARLYRTLKKLRLELEPEMPQEVSR